MKSPAIYGLLGLLLLVTSGCKKDGAAAASVFGRCLPQSPAVKTVTNEEGTVRYDSTTGRCLISSSPPGTFDVVDTGVVCGELPKNLQATGTRVLFSGTFRAYGSPPPLPVGYTYYYLELTSIEAR